MGANGHTHDVVILGTGMAGTILGAILAKHGVDVLLVDRDTHPRFAVGESTIPHTSLLLSILAARHGIPEIDWLAYPDRIARHVCTTCGIKRSFGFAYHRPGERHDPREGLQFGTSSKDENHLFRQDVDAWLLQVAVRYGARARFHVHVEDVRIDEDGATLGTRDGGEIRARYVVDATGWRSVLADRFGLREEPTRLRHRSRTLFTHMIDVKPFDEERNPLTLSWHQSTLHHIFDGGWFWVIPFDNQPSSTNALASVGLTLDPDRFPTGAPPEDEFRDFVRRFPSVAEQFADAKAIRPWTATGRLQFSSKRTTGYRYCLMSHASGAVDALFSRGLINTVELIHALADPLLEALRDDDFAEERFRHLDALQDRVLDYNDALVSRSFASWADFGLWNAWLRVWAFGTILTEFRLMKVLHDQAERGDAALKGEAPAPVFSEYEDPDYADYFRRAVPLVDAVGAGRMSAREAAEGIFALTGEYEFPVFLSVEAMRRAGWLAPEERISDRSVRFAREGYRWALANPTSRDLFGTSETLYRWRARRADPHLAGSAGTDRAA